MAQAFKSQNQTFGMTGISGFLFFLIVPWVPVLSRTRITFQCRDRPLLGCCGRPEPRRDFSLSLAFAAQCGGSKMLREAGKRRRDRRADGRYATGPLRHSPTLALD